MDFNLIDIPDKNVISPEIFKIMAETESYHTLQFLIGHANGKTCLIISYTSCGLTDLPRVEYYKFIRKFGDIIFNIFDAVFVPNRFNSFTINIEDLYPLTDNAYVEFLTNYLNVAEFTSQCTKYSNFDPISADNIPLVESSPSIIHLNDVTANLIHELSRFFKMLPVAAMAIKRPDLICFRRGIINQFNFIIRPKCPECEIGTPEHYPLNPMLIPLSSILTVIEEPIRILDNLLVLPQECQSQ